MKIMVIGALPSSLINFRGELITSLTSLGHQVQCVASNATDIEIKEVEQLGAQYFDCPIQRNGMNPIKDFKTFLSFKKIMANEDPDIVLAYTIKPIIWGGIASKFSKRVNFYGLVTGLGLAFQGGNFKRNLLKRLVQYLYKFSLSKARGVIFQNEDNRELFNKLLIVGNNKSIVVNGSGVNLEFFTQHPLSKEETTFLCIARLLGDKGIREYVEAARIVKEKYPSVRIQLLGPTDPSLDAISIEEVNNWVKSGVIDYLGKTPDVRPFINNSHIIVLPSYHEGLPRTLIEAMSVGRPILTTNVVGCKDTVENGINGWLVPKRNSVDLANRMEWFIENRESWESMAANGNAMARKYFDVNIVNANIIKFLNLD